MGVSANSCYMRDIECCLAEGNHEASLAYEIYVDRIQKHIGQYLAVLNGADACVFTAGRCENAEFPSRCNLRDFVVWL